MIDLDAKDAAMNHLNPKPKPDAKPKLKPDPRILERNLATLAMRSPRAAKQILDAKAHDGFVPVETDEDAVSGTLDGRALASKRRPISEAEKFAGGYDPSKAAAVCVLGFGVGHHCRVLQERAGAKGMVVCFESDVRMLRAVFERIDHSEWIRKGHFMLSTDADDAPVLTQLFSGFEAVAALGMQILEHPASIARLGDSRSRFTKILTEVMRASRTHVVTTLAHAPVSFRNMLMNLDAYRASAGVGQLRGACPGVTAVIVAAGPSLGKNLAVLGDPAIRSRVVVIAVQTVLKTMLEAGIRPDFVTALDYHELSKRFYEGLSAEDVRGIRLVVEPKANPAIIDAFPGEIICIKEKLLDSVLGAEMTREMGELPNGGTVAHLSYYLARSLGCDPVVMIGQDLGFTDGHYYAEDAAIHRVWAGELNAHNTLEMMEWQRIARMKGLLRSCEDIHGKRMYTDEQMSTYLAQFESDFLKDTERGLRVIDATEGGVRKRHAEVMPLIEALADAELGDPVVLPATRADDSISDERLIDRIRTLGQDAHMIAKSSGETIELLNKMLNAGGDQSKIGRLIEKVNKIRDKVQAAHDAYALIEFVNQTAVLNRFRADRAIDVESGLEPVERQQRQIERDIQNVRWTRDAADELGRQMVNTERVLVGEMEKITRDEPEESGECLSESQARRGRVDAIVIADPDFNGLGQERDLGCVLSGGYNALQITIGRLRRCRSLDGVIILTPNPDRIRALLGGLNDHVQIVAADPYAFRERVRSIGAARIQAADCWRGGIGTLSCYDEGLDPRMVYQVMEERRLQAAVIVGADWAMVDPDLVDTIVDRHRSSPDQHRVAFSQAVPGIGAFVVDRNAAQSLANGQANAGSFATLGGLVGYIPIAPQSDPVAKTMCVQIKPALRDAGVRAIPDSASRFGALKKAYERTGEDPIDGDSSILLTEFARVDAKRDRQFPSTVHLEICTGRLSNGPWGRWKRSTNDSCERPVLSIANAHRLLREIIGIRPDAGLVIDGAGDPLMHSDAMGFVQLADELGFSCVELRTDLLCQGVEPEAFVESGLGVLSVDLLANTAETYARVSGQDRFEWVIDRLESIIDARGQMACGISAPWIVPRITRCDLAYEEIPDFYDRWLMRCGAAQIDPLPRRIRGQRLSPLRVAEPRRSQMEAREIRIQCDGFLCDSSGHRLGERSAIDVGIERAFNQSKRLTEPKTNRPAIVGVA